LTIIFFFWLAGATQSLRIKYKSKANFGPGFAIFHTSGEKSSNLSYSSSSSTYSAAGNSYKQDKDHEYIAILNLDTFLEFFNSPLQLADIFTRKGKQLVAAWNSDNSHPGKVGCRQPTSMTYALAEYEWRSGRGKSEKSIWTLQLSTYGFTVNKQQDKLPVIELKDIKVCVRICVFACVRCKLFLSQQVLIKLKSTTNTGGPDESASDLGLLYDGYGYNVSLPHFLGMLRTKNFADFVDSVRSVMSMPPLEAVGQKPEDDMPDMSE
jgi:hypothetical protein